MPLEYEIAARNLLLALVANLDAKEAERTLSYDYMFLKQNSPMGRCVAAPDLRTKCNK